MINSRKLFDDSEAVYPITEEEMIKIEKIHGTLLLIGAEDDVLWDTAKYICRMKQRMKDHPHADWSLLSMSMEPISFSGEYVKDDVANWFWNLYETGISGKKKISERMPESTSEY